MAITGCTVVRVHALSGVLRALVSCIPGGLRCPGDSLRQQIMPVPGSTSRSDLWNRDWDQFVLHNDEGPGRTQGPNTYIPMTRANIISTRAPAGPSGSVSGRRNPPKGPFVPAKKCTPHHLQATRFRNEISPI